MRVTILDPNDVLRDGLRCLFESQPDIEVVGEAGDGREGLRIAEAEHPDIVLTEVVLPELNGADVTRRILKGDARVKVVVLTDKTDEALVREMFEAGASGYVIKSSGSDDLLRALRAVSKGGTWVSPDVAHALVRNGDGNSDSKRVFAELTPREREVLQLVSEGCTSKEIASRMKISVNTVDTHRHHVMKKLDANTVADLVKLAIRAGITSAEG